MRKIYLALSMMAIFAIAFATTITSVKAYTTSFNVDVDPYLAGWTYLQGINPVFGEAIYQDLNAPGTTGNAKVTAGDKRLTPVSDGAGGWYPAGSTVGASDFDTGFITYGAAARWGTVKHAENVLVDTYYEFGEFIYKAAGTTVAVGDTRYSNVPGYKVGSVVATGDTDISTALVTFKGTTAAHYERFTDNLVVNTAYDFARLFVNVYWITDIPNYTPDGMRGFQFIVQVNPDVLTPLTWVGAGPGYVLYDFLQSIPSANTTSMLGTVGTDTLLVTEQILGTEAGGAGDAFSHNMDIPYFGWLITLVFIPQSETDGSHIDFLASSLGYQDMGTETWHTVTLQSGDYNVPGVVPEFPFGIGVLMSIVALVPVIYVWRTRKPRRV